MSAEIITLGGVRYWVAPVIDGADAPWAGANDKAAGVTAPALKVPANAGVKEAFRRAVADKLATGENWSLADIAQAKGNTPATVRKQIGGILQEATPQRRKRGRPIYCTARSVARYLGEAV